MVNQGSYLPTAQALEELCRKQPSVSLPYKVGMVGISGVFLGQSYIVASGLSKLGHWISGVVSDSPNVGDIAIAAVSSYGGLLGATYAACALGVGALCLLAGVGSFFLPTHPRSGEAVLYNRELRGFESGTLSPDSSMREVVPLESVSDLQRYASEQHIGGIYAFINGVEKVGINGTDTIRRRAVQSGTPVIQLVPRIALEAALRGEKFIINVTNGAAAGFDEIVDAPAGAAFHLMGRLYSPRKDHGSLQLALVQAGPALASSR